MNYDPNTIDWKDGDIVIHDADAKTNYMLMKVIGITKTPPKYYIKYVTEYIDKPYHAHSHGFKDEHDPKFILWNRWENIRPVLHDPQRFDISTDDL